MQFLASQKAAELSLQADLQLAGTWYFRMGYVQAAIAFKFKEFTWK